MIINTPLGRVSFYDERAIRRAAMQYAVPSITTLAGLQAAVQGIDEIEHAEPTVLSLQEYHAR